MSVEAVVAIMGLVVMALTFIGGVVLVSQSDERLSSAANEPALKPREVPRGYSAR